MAVRLALQRNTSTKIIHTGAEHYDAHSQRFDIIVFNEVLYYFADHIFGESNAPVSHFAFRKMRQQTLLLEKYVSLLYSCCALRVSGEYS